VQEFNLEKFYMLGKSLSAITRLKTGEPFIDTFTSLNGLQRWARSFQIDTREIAVPNSRTCAQILANDIQRVEARIVQALQEDINGAGLTVEENTGLRQSLESFEREFHHESRRLGIFGVTPKGDRDIRILLDDACRKFEPNVLAVMPDLVKDDVIEAGKCLAFERATACAFHVCRATEGLMRAYYKHLTGNDWPPPEIPPKKPMNKDWKVLVDQLRIKGAPKSIYTRLDEIRDDRNAYAHPDATVPLDEAPIVYDLCTGVMFYMAKEMI